jgi:hypothetical protein
MRSRAVDRGSEVSAQCTFTAFCRFLASCHQSLTSLLYLQGLSLSLFVLFGIMAPRSKDPTNAQLSSRLRYDQGEAPAFLTRMRAQVSGHGSRDEDEPSYDNYEDYADFQGRRRDDDGDDDEDNGGEGGRGGGRVPIPRRPPVPSRPGGSGSDNEGGGAREDGKGELDEEDADDEAPQVVVLKQGKHLSEREVDNEKRKGASSPCMSYNHVVRPNSTWTLSFSEGLVSIT